MSEGGPGARASRPEIFTIEASDESAARGEALEQWMKRFHSGGQFPGLDIRVRLVAVGKKGFLGMGRKLTVYEAEVTARTPPRPPVAQEKAVPQEPIEYLRNLIVSKVAEGFDDDGEIVDLATEIAEDEYPGQDLQEEIARVAQAAFAQHRQEVAQWQGVTDCERLDLAFTKLEAKGIVARQNFACCQTCGQAEIADEIEEALRVREVKGYTFYHMQDTEAAAAGYGLHLAYGSVSGDPDETIEVARNIVDELRRAGLEHEWNGDVARRILVPLDWKKRRHAAADTKHEVTESVSSDTESLDSHSY